MPDPLKRYATPGDAINAWFNIKLSTLNLIVPGIIDSFDHENVTAKVIPSFQEKDATGTYKDRRPIAGVPVLMIGGKNGRIFTHPSKDDPCLILWSRDALDQWKNNPQKTTPRLPGKSFRLSDAVCICGFMLINEESPANTGITFTAGNSRLEIQNETINLTGQNIEINGMEIDDFQTRLNHLISWADTFGYDPNRNY